MITAGSFQLNFKIEDEKAILIGYKEGGSRLVIPAYVDDKTPVTEIAPKVFFANHNLRELVIPETVVNVGDWVFSRCDSLRTVVFENTNVNMGRGIFDGCHRMEKIFIGKDAGLDQSVLMAAVISKMPAEYLLKDEDSGQERWFAKWDQCLSTYINEPDIDGYTDLVLCGEEDIFYNEPDFAMNKRCKKCTLCFLRLMHKECISSDMEKKYTDYLLSHTKGEKSEEAFDVLLNEYGEDPKYFKLFFKLGGINKANIDGMIECMGELHPEAKAYLLELKQTAFSEGDIFDMFKL